MSIFSLDLASDPVVFEIFGNQPFQGWKTERPIPSHEVLITIGFEASLDLV